MARMIVSIVAIAGPRRRAGFSFGPQPVKIDVSELTEEQIEQLKGDPMLAVVDAIDADEAEADAKAKAAADQADADAKAKAAADQADADVKAKAAADQADAKANSKK